MKKDIADYVWPIEGYTDKIHLGVKAVLSLHSHLAFSILQLLPYLEYGLPWLKKPDARQVGVRDKIIQTGIRKLIQQGLVKEVTSKMSIEKQWQWAKAVAGSGYTNITSEDEVARPDVAKTITDRAIGARELWRLNGKPKLGVLHA
jgi:hypothetical protein